MSTIKLTVLAVAIVVGIPVASAVAARQFDRDMACEQSEQALQDTPAVVHVKRLGRDSAFVIDDTLIGRANSLRFTGVVARPGRA
jgi:hypothetical protein